jgi:hypothetical protein
MNLFALFFDNPLIIKHVRARLRRGVLGSICLVVVIVSLIIVLGAFVASASQPDFSAPRFGPRQAEMEAFAEMHRRMPFLTAFGLLLGFQGIVLLLMGTLALGASVSVAHEKGILDFHRISPQSPASMALGFLLGGPIREWLLFFLILPFALFMSFFAQVPPVGYAQIVLTQITTALFFHMMTLVLGLSRVKARTTSSAAVVLVIAVHWIGSGIMWTGSWFPILLTSVPATMQAMLTPMEFLRIPQPAPFFGVPLPLLVLTLLYQLPLMMFLFLMAVRKMRADRLHVFSKPLAVSFMLVTALLTVGSIWSAPRVPALLVLLNVLTYISLFLASNITPSWSDFVNGLRRAAKLGQTRRPPWTDEAANPPAVALLAGILLLCGVAGWWLDVHRLDRFPELLNLPVQPWARSSVPYPVAPSKPFLPLAVAVGWLVAFGCATQYYQLVYGKGGAIAFRLFAFLVWGLPLLLCVLAGMAQSREAATILLALSPPSGLVLTCLPDETFWGTLDAGQYLAAIAAVTTAAIFAALLWGALQRAAAAAARLQDAPIRVTVEPLGRLSPARGPLLVVPEVVDVPPARPVGPPDGIRTGDAP